MLYLIDNKYYIKTAPLQYTEVSFVLKNDTVDIQPTNNKIETNMNAQIKSIVFRDEKDKIMKSLQANDRDNKITYKKRNKR